MKLPQKPPSFQSLFSALSTEKLLEFSTAQPWLGQGHEYWHWDKLRHKRCPEGLTHEEWWVGLKMARMQMTRRTPFTDAQGKAFVYCMPDEVLEALHRIDSEARGQIGAQTQVVNAENRDRYIIRSLMEEAITSSQLEGASTTSKDALDMLRSGRKPLDISERMILNNYRAMQFICESGDQALTPAYVLELHRILTEETLEDPGAAGRMQTKAEKRVAVYDNRDNTLLHSPPSADELEDRLPILCDFANGGESKGQFIHPILRAIILHFALAYDHPFEDGNGRTARALFYWSMLKQGYWLFEFVSISNILKAAPSKYARAFQYTETDDNDLTYFILHQLDVIVRAIRHLHEWLERKTLQVREVEERLAATRSLNHRQRALIAHALRHPLQIYTIESHQTSHDVAYATARADLYQLADLGWLESSRAGRRMEFRPGRKLRAEMAT